MDIPSLSMSLSQSNTMNQVGAKVLGMSLDMAESTGEAVASMLDSVPVDTAVMERSVTPYLGGNFDMSV